MKKKIYKCGEKWGWTPAGFKPVCPPVMQAGVAFESDFSPT